MQITLEIPDSLKLRDHVELSFFLQAQVNRLLVGQARYGVPHYSKKYQSRAVVELYSYAKTGNFEHLLNVANYAFLESVAPENRRFHFDPKAASVTRGLIDRKGI